MKLKALVLATTTVFAAGALPLSVSAEQPGMVEKTGEYLNDAALTTQVKAALLAEDDLKSLGINVESTDGVVTLAGEVPNEASVELAESLTRQVKGVRDVHNKLEVSAS